MDASKIYNEKFTKKYHMYSEMLYRLSMIYLKNRMDCEDVLQETFVKLYFKTPCFNDLEHEKRWLIRVVVNLCKDRIKSDFRKYEQPLNDQIFKVETKEEYSFTEKILELPQKLKAPIHLYYFEGYKVKEIAHILNISSSAVKMRLKRGREALKLEMENDGFK